MSNLMWKAAIQRSKLHAAGIAGAHAGRSASDLFNDQDVSWMVDPILDHLLADGLQTSLCGKIKAHPPLASADEKRAFGINPRLKVGRAFATCLTDIGRADPNLAAQTMSSFIARHIQNTATIAHARRCEALLWLNIPYDGACASAQRLAGDYFPADEVACLPLKDCLAEVCHCSVEQLLVGSARAAAKTRGLDVEEIEKELIGTRPDPHEGKRLGKVDPETVQVDTKTAPRLATIRQLAPRPVMIEQPAQADSGGDAFIFVAAALIVLIFAIFVSMR